MMCDTYRNEQFLIWLKVGKNERKKSRFFGLWELRNKTYANGDASSEDFLAKILLSVNSRRYFRTASVGKKGKKV